MKKLVVNISLNIDGDIKFSALDLLILNGFLTCFDYFLSRRLSKNRGDVRWNIGQHVIF